MSIAVSHPSPNAPRARSTKTIQGASATVSNDTPDISIDTRHMQHALALASRALGQSSPNPLVGCVIARGETVIGEGWHHGAGQPHAEIEALNSVTQGLRGATAYVTLEPCNHHGRTPPCSKALLDAGIARLVYALPDPNPVAAGGAARLAAAGITVEGGLLAEEAAHLNRFFLSSVVRQRPWVIAKSAHSLDGRVATREGHSQWITGDRAREQGHRIRQAVDAILVGPGTVIADNPSLDVRLPDTELPRAARRHPTPVIIDRQQRVPLDCRLLATADRPCIYVTATSSETPSTGSNGRSPTASHAATVAGNDGNRLETLRNRGHQPVLLPLRESGDFDLTELLHRLHELGIQSLLVEGGAAMHGAFADATLIDEFALFIAPLIIGGAGAPSAFGGTGPASLDDAMRLQALRCEALGDDWYLNGLSGSGMNLLERYHGADSFAQTSASRLSSSPAPAPAPAPAPEYL